MEREDLTVRLEWLKEPGSYKPDFSGKRVELTKPFELTPIQGDESSAPVEGKGPIIEVPATEETAKQQSVPGEPILEAIRSRTDLKTVSMEGNSYSKPFCQALAHILKTKTTIERALFNDMFVGRKIPDIHPSLKYFAEAFLRFDHLTVLDFSDNAVNPSGAENIAPLLRQCLTLKELYLNNTGVGPAGGETIGKALQEAHERGVKEGRPYCLEKFVLGRSRLEIPGCREVSKAFARIRTLREIRINNNGIFTEGLVDFAQAVAKNPNLEVLEVSDNHLKTRAGLALAKALRHLRHLRVFIASDTGLKDRAGVAVVESLAEAPIAVLNLAYNEMSKKVLTKILTKLNGKTFDVLDVQGNYFGDNGYEQLEDMFPDTQPEDQDVDSELEECTSDDEEHYDDEVVPDVSPVPTTAAEAQPPTAVPKEAEEDVGAEVAGLTLSSTAETPSMPPGTTAPLPLPNIVPTLLQTGDKTTFVRRALEPYIMQPTALAFLFFELSDATDGKVSPANAQSVDAFMQYVLKQNPTAFVNSLLVGLGLLKPEFECVGRGRTRAVEQRVEDGRLLPAWSLLTHCINQDYFASVRGLVASLASDDSIAQRSRSSYHRFLQQTPYVKTPSHPVNTLRRAAVNVARQ